MAQPYVGEIRIFAGNFPPDGWLFCSGQLLPISEPDNQVLFQLIGTTYGGNGESTFALPDLRGRLPIHMNGEFILGETGGAEQITLTVNQIPAHNHALQASSNNASSTNAAGNVLATTPTYTPYIADVPNTPLVASAVAPTGGSQPHSNLQPFLCVNFIISLFGIFPTQT